MNPSASVWSRIKSGLTVFTRRPKSQLVRIREKWGHEVSGKRDFNLISLFHRFSSSERRIIDEQTWHDLGMDDVFAKIDRTISMPGRQVLYERLRVYVDDLNILRERAHQHQIFREDTDLRERAQLALIQLDRSGAEYLAPLLFTPFPNPPRFVGLLYLLSAVPLACAVGALFTPQLLPPAFLFVCINTVIYLTYGQKISPYFAGFSQIRTLLSVAEMLTRIPDRHHLPDLESLRTALPVLERVTRRLRWLVTDRSAMPELAQAVFGYLNMFFLLDVIVFIRSLSVLRENQKVLAATMENVGSVDATLSVASYIESVPYCCVPEFTDERRLAVVGMFHPLIDEAVSNPFSLERRSALIAGPNMAGKTSFVRTVGIALVLAQTLNLCLAQQATLPRAMVRSSIRREDKLADGESYFFSEIKQILEFIRVEKKSSFHVFLIDEIFRGTNTVERIASSVAVLRHLAQDHMVFVTTHDLKLQELLADSFDMHHFGDRVENGEYGFSYLIRPGPVQSRNAIKLLELSGYPESITREAEGLAEELSV